MKPDTKQYRVILKAYVTKVSLVSQPSNQICIKSIKMKLTHSLSTLFLVVISITAGLAQQAISPAQFHEQMNKSASIQLVDVRTANEYAGGHLYGAQNIDFRSSDFAKKMAKLDKSQPLFIYCLSGGRSASASRKLTNMGFNEVYDMKGGIMAWKQAELPLRGASNSKQVISKSQYNKLINSDKPVLIDFYATWCSPCRKMAPMLEELKKDYAGKFSLVKIDADKNDLLLKELNVSEIPTFYLYNKGQKTWTHVGLVEKEVLIKELSLR